MPNILEEELRSATTISQFAALAQQVKTAMIIEMALDFATMIRILAKASKPRITAELECVFGKLDSIRDQRAYDRLHSLPHARYDETNAALIEAAFRTLLRAGFHSCE